MKNKKRKIDRKKLIHTLVFALFCVLGLTVAYAALSTSLNISGNAQVASSEWSFLVEDTPTSTIESEMGESYAGVVKDNYASIGNAELTTKGTISGTSINNIGYSFLTPGDELCVFYDFTNTGSIPAVLSSYNISTPTITSSTNNSNDVAWANENFFFYPGLVKDGKVFNVDSVLCPEETATVMICGIVNSSATTVPSSTLTVSNLGANFEFTQGETRSCPT